MWTLVNREGGHSTSNFVRLFRYKLGFVVVLCIGLPLLLITSNIYHSAFGQNVVGTFGKSIVRCSVRNKTAESSGLRREPCARARRIVHSHPDIYELKVTKDWIVHFTHPGGRKDQARLTPYDLYGYVPQAGEQIQLVIGQHDPADVRRQISFEIMDRYWKLFGVGFVALGMIFGIGTLASWSDKRTASIGDRYGADRAIAPEPVQARRTATNTAARSVRADRQAHRTNRRPVAQRARGLW